MIALGLGEDERDGAEHLGAVAERAGDDLGRLDGRGKCGPFQRLAHAVEQQLARVRESLLRSALPTAAEAAMVVAGTLGDRAEVLGAIALVLSEADRDHPLRPMAEAAAR